MPFEFEFDHQIEAFIIRVQGIVDASDFINAMAAVREEAGYKRNINQLVDFRMGSLDLPESRSLELAKFFKSAPVREALGSSYKLAFVTTSSLDFGQLRMYEAHSAELSDKGVEIRVFRCMEEARLWLGEKSSRDRDLIADAVLQV